MLKIKVNRLVARRPRLFTGVKRRTLPNQAMSLAEMFRRFVRREPLPVEKEGVYVESDYDLEKIAHMDTVEKEEVLQEMKESTRVKEAKVKKAQEAHEAKEAAKKKRDDEAEADMRARIEKQKDPKDSSSKPPVSQE